MATVPTITRNVAGSSLSDPADAELDGQLDDGLEERAVGGQARAAQGSPG